MLQSLRIENFKSFKNTTLKLSPFTLMIGANASGKSNAIEALCLTNLLANGLELKNISSKLSQDLNFRGSELTFFEEDNNKISFALNFTKLEKENAAELQFTLEKQTLTNEAPTFHIHEEVFSYNNDLVYSKVIFPPYDNQLGRKYNVTITGKNSPMITDTANTLQLYTANILDSIRDHDLKTTPVKDKTIQTITELQKLFILNVNPHKMRGYVSSKSLELQSDGENLSAILFELCKNKENKELLLKLIGSIPEQNITDIKFIETERGDVMLRLVENFSGKERLVDAPFLSDGTLRALAIGAYTLFMQEGTMLVIEEIDNGIHPSRVKHLFNEISTLAAKRKVQILMTSHNPALLDSVPANELENVLVCYRDKEDGDSRLTRLGDLNQYSELVAQGSLGTIVTNGLVEKFVHDKRTLEEIHKESLAWLEEFKNDIKAI